MKVKNTLNCPNMYARAKKIDEPFVKEALEERGWTVEFGTQNEDFNHIDLKVYTKENEFCYNIDVKRNNPNNKNSKNFSLTTTSRTGKKFPFNDKDFFAFIDDVSKTIILVSQKIIKDLNAREYSSFKNTSKYILIPKEELYKHGTLITPSDKLKKMLDN